jgi:hypothetical protein
MTASPLQGLAVMLKSFNTLPKKEGIVNKTLAKVKLI